MLDTNLDLADDWMLIAYGYLFVFTDVIVFFFFPGIDIVIPGFAHMRRTTLVCLNSRYI